MTRRTAIPAETSPDALTAAVLNEAQRSFPLEERPYAAIGARLGIDEASAFGRLTAAREAGLVRQVSAIFDTRAIGYGSTLVAMRVAPERVERAVAVVNAHPGVSHHYERTHDFNLWFTVAVPPATSLDQTVERVATLAGAESCRMLPALRLFKIGVSFALGEDPGAAGIPRADEHTPVRGGGGAPPAPLDADDVAFVRAAQADLAGTARPFHAIAASTGEPVARVIERARALQASGHLRRFAALLHHRRAGFRANGMTVWSVAPERADEAGRAMATFREVTHCYERPTYPDWPYALFTMIHGRERADVERVIDAIGAATGIDDHLVLYSTTEFKKVRLRYFAPEHERWESLCLAAANAYGDAAVPAALA